MFAKTFAVLAVLLLPLNLSLWHRSHSGPVRYRCDLTVYKSLTLYLREGVVAAHVLTMPTRTASRTDFQSPLKHDMTPSKGGIHLSSTKNGEFTQTWFVFPFWLSTLLLTFICIQPVFAGPIRHAWRNWRGRCPSCGYDLTGNRTGRCSECGEHVRKSSVRHGRRRASAH